MVHNHTIYSSLPGNSHTIYSSLTGNPHVASLSFLARSLLISHNDLPLPLSLESLARLHNHRWGTLTGGHRRPRQRCHGARQRHRSSALPPMIWSISLPDSMMLMMFTASISLLYSIRWAIISLISHTARRRPAAACGRRIEACGATLTMHGPEDAIAWMREAGGGWTETPFPSHSIFPPISIFFWFFAICCSCLRQEEDRQPEQEHGEESSGARRRDACSTPGAPRYRRWAAFPHIELQNFLFSATRKY